MMRCRQMGSLGGWRCLALLLLAGSVFAATGCTRRFYRDRADSEVMQIITEKDVVPDWKIEQFGVYPDSRARFADPTNPDRPPMPPDDPAAQSLAPNPQKPPHKAGIARVEGSGYLDLLASWDAYNRGAPRGQAEEQGQEPKDAAQDAPVLPAPRALVHPSAARRANPYLIKLEQAVELGLINSREYQTRREDLYLAALPVSSERFGFAYQFFATEQAIREWTGDGFTSGKGDRWRLNSDVGFAKLFPRGALLLFAFANRTIIELSGRRDTTSVSTINLDFVQPLLRGGGKAVTLEPLTQAERNLVYEIRDYARFRKEYFQYISGGGDLASLGIVGAGFGRAFSPGAVSLGAGNPASLQISPGGAGRVDLTGAGRATSEGFLPTVQRRGLIKIEQDNVRRFTDIVKLYEAYEEGGEVSSLQVGTLQLDLLAAQSALLQRNQEYSDALDRFKQQLGLPPPLPLELDDGLVQVVLKQYDRFETALQQFETLVKTLEQYDAPEDAPQVRERIRKLLTESPLVVETKAFRSTIEDRWKRWQPPLDDKGLGEILEQLRTRRTKLLDLKTERELDGKTLTAQEQKTLRDSIAELALGEMEGALRRYERAPWAKLEKAREQADLRAQLFRTLRNAVVDVLGEASNERIELLRPLWPSLPVVPVGGMDLATGNADTALDVAVEAALANRLDLMNARAQVVDSWRQIAVFANSLLGTFNVGYHMDSSTPPGQAKPLAFQPQQTRHQLFLNAELPLVRLTERNNYRGALIAYQRARRALMAAEDAVAAQVRAEVRQLQVLARNYQIQKQSVELAFQQVENSLETFRAPQQPGGGGQSAASVAALTQQLQGAYRSLPNAQRQLLGTWIQYLVARQQMYLDLELLPLDSRGVWIDEHATGTPIGQPLPEPERGPPPG